MRTGPNPGRIFELSQNELTVGRDVSNDIVINDAEVSRKHARLIAQTGGYVLEDTGSTNGTFVNGQRLMGPHLLRAGETILLGENVTLTYEETSYDPDATLAASYSVPEISPEAPPPMEVREAYLPPRQQQAPPRPVQAPPPVYTGTVPPGPVETYEFVDERRSTRTWLYAGCGCLVVLLCLLLVGAYAFDTLNLYCTPPFNALFACP
jgi:hypothetical protein